jgi:NTE family protein
MGHSHHSYAGHERPPRRTVLVLQGGGALGAYQFGVYQALHEAGIEPDWVIGTSIGAINASLIAGNPPARRLERMETFWERVTHRGPSSWLAGWISDWARAQHTQEVVLGGLSGFFRPHWVAWGDDGRALGVEHAAYYRTDPLRETLGGLVDTGLLAQGPTRISVGAVNVRNGQMRYFDSRREPVGLDAIMASGALAPAFPAVRIDGEPYWDGGLYSNSPIEVVLDDEIRVDSLIFTTQLWRAEGEEPASVAAIHERLKDIQFASRADTHIERQRQLHRLRHVVHQLINALPEAQRTEALWQEHRECACDSVMHVVKLRAPRLPCDGATKDIDFSRQGIAARRAAGYVSMRAALEAKPWDRTRGLLEGLCVHEVEAACDTD